MKHRSTETRPEGERPIDRVLRWAGERGWNQSAFARELGVEPGHVTNWKDRDLPTDRYEEVASLLGRSLDEIAGRVPEESKSTSVRRAANRIERVPVIGTAQPDKDGVWREVQNSETPEVGHIEMPSPDRNAYAVKITGDSMHPRIKSGEYVVVLPGQPYVSGDEVLVVTKDGRNMVREFLFRRDGCVSLLGINGAERLTLPESEISTMHYVAAIAKSNLYSED